MRSAHRGAIDAQLRIGKKKKQFREFLATAVAGVPQSRLAQDMGKQGSKYGPLHAFLRADGRATLCLSLEEIEEILGFGLTASAEKAGWWVNVTAVKTRAQTWAWVDAGYEASLRHGLVTFRRAHPTTTRDDALGRSPLA